jgi:hypothetical protein
MAKMSKKSMCGMGMGMTMGKGLGMNILMLAVYLVIAYVAYQVVMYFMGGRPSAMPNVTPPNGRMGGSCASGTCGAPKKEGMMPKFSQSTV